MTNNTHLETISQEDLEAIEMAVTGSVIECDCCGELVEPDGECPEGTPSILVRLGMI